MKVEFIKSRGGLGPPYWLCMYCWQARASKFTCKCVPEWVGYCWECLRHGCEHTEGILKEWSARR